MNWVGNDKTRLNFSSSYDWCIAGFRNPSVPFLILKSLLVLAFLTDWLRGSSFARLFIPMSSHSQSKHFLRHFDATPQRPYRYEVELTSVQVVKETGSCSLRAYVLRREDFQCALGSVGVIGKMLRRGKERRHRRKSSSSFGEACACLACLETCRLFSHLKMPDFGMSLTEVT